MRLRLLPIALAISMTGCAIAPTHDKKVSESINSAANGRVEDAIVMIDKQIQSGDKKDLLLNLEIAELLRMANKYRDSQSALSVADTQVNTWEETAKSSPAKLLGTVGTTIMGETSKTYEGQDYEKVMLTTRMAMNNIALGDLDTARVDIKRTHEREAVIAQFRSKETFEAESSAKSKGIDVTSKELNGYPIETLNDPEVLALKNGYQNALSHYLAGYVYEALNEPGLSAPGYRLAIELRPGLPLLEEGLAGLDKRNSFRRQKGMTDVLFVVETGNAPSRQSKKLTLPIPTGKGMIVASFAYPVIYPDPNAIDINRIAFGNQMLKTALIADFNVMARRSLKDEMPGIQLRSVVRAVGKGLIQNELNKHSPMVGLLGNIMSAATESPADDRMWRGLPGRVFIARGFITPGQYQLAFPDQNSDFKSISVDGRYMVIPVRIFQGKTYFGEPAKYGQVIPSIVEKAATPLVPVAPVAENVAVKKVVKVKKVKQLQVNNSAQ
jgi:hypothetical protein